jgi:hypothetical protein
VNACSPSGLISISNSIRCMFSSGKGLTYHQARRG